MTEYHYTSHFKALAVLPKEGSQGLPDDGVYRGQDPGTEASELAKRTWHGDHLWGMLVGSNHLKEELSHELSVLPVSHNQTTKQDSLAGLSNVALFGLPTHRSPNARGPLLTFWNTLPISFCSWFCGDYDRN
jgi:hypothetical protein